MGWDLHAKSQQRSSAADETGCTRWIWRALSCLLHFAPPHLFISCMQNISGAQLRRRWGWLHLQIWRTLNCLISRVPTRFSLATCQGPLPRASLSRIGSVATQPDPCCLMCFKALL